VKTAKLFSHIIFIIYDSGVGSYSKVGGLFKLSGHICMEKNYIPMDSKNWGGSAPYSAAYDLQYIHT